MGRPGLFEERKRARQMPGHRYQKNRSWSSTSETDSRLATWSPGEREEQSRGLYSS